MPLEACRFYSCVRQMICRSSGHPEIQPDQSRASCFHRIRALSLRHPRQCSDRQRSRPPTYSETRKRVSDRTQQLTCYSSRRKRGQHTIGYESHPKRCYRARGIIGTLSRSAAVPLHRFNPFASVPQEFAACRGLAFFDVYCLADRPLDSHVSSPYARPQLGAAVYAAFKTRRGVKRKHGFWDQCPEGQQRPPPGVGPKPWAVEAAMSFHEINAACCQDWSLIAGRSKPARQKSPDNVHAGETRNAKRQSSYIRCLPSARKPPAVPA